MTLAPNHPALAANSPSLAEAQALVAQLQAQIQSLELKNQRLVLELAHLKRIRFGTQSEALSVEQKQLFEDDADQDLAAIAAELDETPASNHAPVSRLKPRPLLGVSLYPSIWNGLKYVTNLSNGLAGNARPSLSRSVKTLANNWILCQLVSLWCVTSGPSMPAASAKPSLLRQCHPQ